MIDCIAVARRVGSLHIFTILLFVVGGTFFFTFVTLFPAYEETDVEIERIITFTRGLFSYINALVN